ncbi:hypothetical protein VOWphi5012_078 [Vibrio phage phi50-12]|uniref:Uncharacterized protein n=1 Tax=Vibrio phage phi50-12 TaxID=2654972 RepID=A0A5P8PRG3_9CAUD|nr:hypothetical protein KNU82_gp078 [Vibrio phage phi50-12]QFR59862.1 hypothetical protein VOWphi5012_078 [Vibrio phage phi50-12]
MKLFKAVIVLKDCTHVRKRLKTVPVRQIKVTLNKPSYNSENSYKWLLHKNNKELDWLIEGAISSRYFDIILIKEIPSEPT